MPSTGSGSGSGRGTLWLTSHALCVLAQFGIAAAGIVCFVAYSEANAQVQSESQTQAPSQSQIQVLGNGVVYSALPYAALGVSVFSVTSNGAIIAGYKLQQHSTSPVSARRLLLKLLVLAFDFFLNTGFCAADLALAAAVGSSSRAAGAAPPLIALCALLAFGAATALSALVADVLKIRNCRRQRKSLGKNGGSGEESEAGDVELQQQQHQGYQYQQYQYHQ